MLIPDIVAASLAPTRRIARPLRLDARKQDQAPHPGVNATHGRVNKVKTEPITRRLRLVWAVGVESQRWNSRAALAPSTAARASSVMLADRIRFCSKTASKTGAHEAYSTRSGLSSLTSLSMKC